MCSAFGPIEAQPAELAAGRIQRCEVDSELGEKAPACLRDFGSSFSWYDVFVCREEVRYIHAETTGKMVVANPGVAKLSGLRREWTKSGSVLDGNDHDSVEHFKNFR